MGFWDKVFKKPQKQIRYNLADILSGYVPIYSNGFGENIYASDVVQQAIYSIVTELKKLDPVHVRKIANDFINVEGSIQNVLDAPNPLMTTSDFIEKIAWTLLLNYNAFIYPIWEGETLIALYPLQPSLVEFDPDYNGSGKMWVRFTFPNGYKGDIPYEDVIHLKYHYAKSEFMGGDESGNPNYQPLLDTLKLNDTLLKGLAKSLNMQTTINGLVKLKTMANYDDQVAKIKEFEKKLQSNESGIGITDVASEFTPITKQVQLLDATTLEFIDRKILRTFGVSIPIVNGDYTKEQYEAFYQKTLEPIVKSFGQAFTKGIFTKRATQGFNNKIVFYVKELIFMNTDQKLNLFNTLGNIGGCYVNEMRVAFGLAPINDLQGVRMQSLNFVDSDYAKEYQTGNLNAQQAQPAPAQEEAPADDNSGNSEGGGNSEPTNDSETNSKTLLVGQIQALLEIVAQFQTGILGYDQAINMIIITIGLSQEEAEKLLDKDNVKSESDTDTGTDGGIE